MAKDDDFDFDNDDLGLDDELGKFDLGDGESSAPTGNDRSAFTRSLKDVGKGVLESTVGSPLETAADIAKASIPDKLSSEYGKITSVSSDIKDTFTSAAADVKKSGKQTVDAVNKLLPENSAIRKLLSKISSKLGDDDVRSNGPSKEDIENSNIANSVTEAIGKQIASDEINNLLRTSVEEKRHLRTTELLGTLTAETEHLRKFQFEITNSYYRRSLELQYKSLFTAKEQLEILRTGMDTFKNQFETIINNTAMPDIVKARNNEKVKEALIATTVNHATDLFYNKYEPLQNIRNNSINYIKDTANNLKDGFNNITDIADQASGAMEMGSMTGSKSYLIGSIIGSLFKEKLGNVVGSKLFSTDRGKDATFKIKDAIADPNSTLREFGKNASNTEATGIRGLFNKVFGNAAEIVSDLAGSRRESDITFNKQNMDEASLFDGRTHTSIVKVIPGLLSKIYGEVKSIRSGNNNPTQLEEHYDYASSKFSTKKAIKDNFNTDTTSLMSKSVMYGVNRLITSIMENGQLDVNKTDMKILNKHIVKYFMNPRSPINPTALKSNKFLDGLPDKLKDSVKTSIDKLLRKAKDDYNIMDELSSTMKDISVSLPNTNSRLQEMHKSGLLDVAEEMGIVKRDPRTKDYVYDNEAGVNYMVNSVDNISDLDIELEKLHREAVEKKKKEAEKNKNTGGFKSWSNNKEDNKKSSRKDPLKTPGLASVNFTDADKEAIRKHSILSESTNTVKDSESESTIGKTVDYVKNVFNKGNDKIVNTVDNIVTKGIIKYNNFILSKLDNSLTPDDKKLLTELAKSTDITMLIKDKTSSFNKYEDALSKIDLTTKDAKAAVKGYVTSLKNKITGTNTYQTASGVGSDIKDSINSVVDNSHILTGTKNKVVRTARQAKVLANKTKREVKKAINDPKAALTKGRQGLVDVVDKKLDNPTSNNIPNLNIATASIALPDNIVSPRISLAKQNDMLTSKEDLSLDLQLNIDIDYTDIDNRNKLIRKILFRGDRLYQKKPNVMSKVLKSYMTHNKSLEIDFYTMVKNTDIPIYILEMLTNFKYGILLYNNEKPLYQGTQNLAGGIIPNLYTEKGDIVPAVLILNMSNIKRLSTLVNTVAHEYTHYRQHIDGRLNVSQPNLSNWYTNYTTFDNKQYLTADHFTPFGKYLKSPWEDEAYKVGYGAEYDFRKSIGLIDDDESKESYIKTRFGDLKRNYYSVIKDRIKPMHDKFKSIDMPWLYNKAGVVKDSMLQKYNKKQYSMSTTTAVANLIKNKFVNLVKSPNTTLGSLDTSITPDIPTAINLDTPSTSRDYKSGIKVNLKPTVDTSNLDTPSTGRDYKKVTNLKFSADSNDLDTPSYFRQYQHKKVDLTPNIDSSDLSIPTYLRRKDDAVNSTTDILRDAAGNIFTKVKGRVADSDLYKDGSKLVNDTLTNIKSNMSEQELDVASKLGSKFKGWLNKGKETVSGVRNLKLEDLINTYNKGKDKIKSLSREDIDNLKKTVLDIYADYNNKLPSDIKSKIEKLIKESTTPEQRAELEGYLDRLKNSEAFRIANGLLDDATIAVNEQYKNSDNIMERLKFRVKKKMGQDDYDNAINVNIDKYRVPTYDEIKILRTEFFNSEEYKSGSVTDFREYLIAMGYDLARKNIDDILDDHNNRNISNFRRNRLDSKLKKEAKKTMEAAFKVVQRPRKLDDLKEEFFKSEEYRSGAVTDFDKWVESMGYNIAQESLIRRVFKKTREWDRKIFFGLPKMLGKGVVGGLKLGFGAGKLGGGVLGKTASLMGDMLGIGEDSAVKAATDKTRELDKQVMMSTPGIIASTLKLPFTAIGKVLSLLSKKKPDESKNPFDKDGDGDRDGNWRDRLNLFKRDKSDSGKGIKDRVTNFIKENKGLSLATGLIAMTAFLKEIGVSVSDFKDFAVGFKNGIVNMTKAIITIGSGIAKVYNAIKDMGKFIGEGIGSMAGGVWSFIKKIVPDWMLPDSAKTKTIIDANGKEVEVDEKGNPIQPPSGVNETAVTGGEMAAYGVGGALAYKPLKGLYDAGKKSFINKSLAASKATGTVSKTSKVVSSALDGKSITSKVKAMINTIKTKIISKIGPKAGGTILTRLGGILLPIGAVILAYHAAMIAKDMVSNGTNFKTAVSNQLLGFDIFDDDSVPVDSNGEPIKPDNSIIDTGNIVAANNTTYTKTPTSTSEQPSMFSRLKTSVSNKLSSVGSTLSDGWEAAKKYVTSGIGSIAAYFESGAKGAGVISSGSGDHGGVSYGTFQLSSKTGTLQKYLAGSKYREEFDGLVPGTPAFNTKWKEIYNRDKEGFAKDQEAFITKTHYEPQVDKLRSLGLDVTNRPNAVKSSVFSVGVQFGPNSNLIPNALAANNIDPTNVNDADLVKSIYKYKQDNNDTLFKSSSSSVKLGTLSRAHKEEKLVTDMLGSDTPIVPDIQQSKTSLSKTVDSIKSENNTGNVTNNSVINKDMMVESNSHLSNINTTLTKSLEVQIRMANAIDKLVSSNIDITKVSENKPVNNAGSTTLPEPSVSMKRKTYNNVI